MEDHDEAEYNAAENGGRPADDNTVEFDADANVEDADVAYENDEDNVSGERTDEVNNENFAHHDTASADDINNEDVANDDLAANEANGTEADDAEAKEAI